MKFLRKYNKLLSQIVIFCFIGGERVKTTELFEVEMAERICLSALKSYKWIELDGLDPTSPPCGVNNYSNWQFYPFCIRLGWHLVHWE